MLLKDNNSLTSPISIKNKYGFSFASIFFDFNDQEVDANHMFKPLKIVEIEPFGGRMSLKFRRRTYYEGKEGLL